jgi:redox-sensitive bicupin YhaK (pirin superfamily)
MYAGLLEPGQTASHALASGRHAWVHVVRGRARVNGIELATGDGVAISGEAAVGVEGLDACELLVFDLA